MSRYIDADKLIELCEMMADKCDGIGESVWNQFATTVDWSPTVDAVPVVRCKDCIHWQKELFGSRWCKGIERIDGDWFCADGEKVAES